MLRAAIAWVRHEYRQCREELDRLRGLPHRRMPVVGAIGTSVLVAALGNAVVGAGRRWKAASEWITLLGVPAIGFVGAAVLLCRGWGRRDLGFQWPAADPPRRFAHGVIVLAVAVATAFGIIGRITGEDVPVFDVVRLLVGTAFGEELVHRGVVLGVWVSTAVRGRWIVLANMVTFALWHVAVATPPSGFRWWEVAGPGALALILLWGRLRSRSVAAPTSFHAGSNMAEFLPPI